MQKSRMFLAAFLLAPGLALLPVAGQQAGFTGVPAPVNSEPIPKVPVGFTPIFNGKDLTGWHVSKTNHHGTTPDFHVMPGGILAVTQNPLGKGGILLTDKKYKDVEVYMEVKPDWGCDSGLFLRSNEAGDAYQITLDYLPGGSMGGIYGEGLQGVSMFSQSLAPEQREAAMARFTENWKRAWKREQWNSVRGRITGDPPHVSAWINDVPVLDWRDTANHAAGGAVDGMIAIQSHMGNRWVPGGLWRWRVIAVKELP
jgi:hypothetical protein